MACEAITTSFSIAEDGVAPFIFKLYELVTDTSSQQLISWSEEHHKLAFVVWDPAEFASHILPKFFKHSNFCSYHGVTLSFVITVRFVRQLNIYGFHKIESRDGYTFMHDCFRLINTSQLLTRLIKIRCGSPHLLKYIQRRKPVKKEIPPPGTVLVFYLNQAYFSSCSKRQP